MDILKDLFVQIAAGLIVGLVLMYISYKNDKNKK